jgi:hypothetical protein
MSPFCDNQAAVPGVQDAFTALHFALAMLAPTLSMLGWAHCASCLSSCSASPGEIYVKRITSGHSVITVRICAVPAAA